MVCEQLATPMTFGVHVNYLPYEEADETGTVTGTFSGWGGTLVIHFSEHNKKFTMKYLV